MHWTLARLTVLTLLLATSGGCGSAGNLRTTHVFPFSSPPCPYFNYGNSTWAGHPPSRGYEPLVIPATTQSTPIPAPPDDPAPDLR